MEQEYLDSFHEPQEFWYVAKDADGGEDDDSCDKWWIPTVRVPPLVARVDVLTAVGVLRHVPEFLGLVETVKVLLLHAQRISVASQVNSEFGMF